MIGSKGAILGLQEFHEDLKVIGSTPGFANITQTPGAYVPRGESDWGNPRFIYDEFIGQIVDKGPNGEPDYADSRYWIRQSWERSPNDSTPQQRPTFERAASILQNQKITEVTAKHVIATNLAEYNQLGSAGDSHGLATDGSVIVWVRMIRGPKGVAKYLFSQGGGAVSGMIWVVIRGVYLGGSKWMNVQRVDYRIEEGQTEARVVLTNPNDVFRAVAKPGMLAEHYKVFVWEGTIHQTMTRFLPAFKMGSFWHVMPQFDTIAIKMPQGVRYSDCMLTRMPRT